MIYFGQYFHLPVFSHLMKLHANPNFFSGIVCGPLWGSFVALGSFAVQFGDHLRSGIICGLGIICGAVQNSRRTSEPVGMLGTAGTVNQLLNNWAQIVRIQYNTILY